jgi:GntR family transcriptional regulator/MocR family aminotransferase
MHNNIKGLLYGYGYTIDRDSKNIYLQLYEVLKKAIIERELEEDMKLPPSRVLAKDLKISRSTVTKAYELLALEKYVSSIQGSGIYVRPANLKKSQYKIGPSTHKGKHPKLSRKAKSYIKNVHIKVENGNGIAFRPGLPPLDIFPIQIWKNLSNNYWKTVTASKLSYSNCFGIAPLRQGISTYLRVYRGIKCDPDQIIVTTGSLHSLSLLSEVLLNKKDKVVIENPTYPLAYSLFKSLRAQLVPVPVDTEGIQINTLPNLFPKLLYTTPSNQYPTGAKMSLARRISVLNWASKNHTLIVEDDYDHEFSNWERPIASIYSMDREDRTVYLGTFNKLLHPAIRIGYMVVPEFLKEAIRALYHQSSRFVSPSSQAVLGYFIEKDHLNKHLRKVIEVSNERKSYFLDHFQSIFEDRLKIDPAHAGLHLNCKLPQGLDDVALTSFLKQHHIVAHPYSNYYIDGPPIHGLMMGFSSVKKKVIKETLYKMARVYRTYNSQIP